MRLIFIWTAFLFAFLSDPNNMHISFRPAQVSLLSARLSQLETLDTEIIFSTCFFLHRHGRPCHRRTLIPVSKTPLARALYFIRTTSTLFSRSYSSLFVLRRKTMPTHTGPKILHWIFLSIAPRATASDLNNIHTSTPYKTTGSISNL